MGGGQTFVHIVYLDILRVPVVHTFTASYALVLIPSSRSANRSHMMALLQQLLYSESLSLSWRDIIVPVVRQVVQTVRPDVRSCDDDMDIRQLVHIKKVKSRFLTVSVLRAVRLRPKSESVCVFFLGGRLYVCSFVDPRRKEVRLCPSEWLRLH